MIMNNGLLQKTEWKAEEHLPVIVSHYCVKKNETVRIKVKIGKQINHPGKNEHNIAWIDIYFSAQDVMFPQLIGRVEFTSNGELAQDTDTGAVHSCDDAIFKFKPDKSGVIYATSYCDTHGFCQSSAELKVV